MDNGLMKTVFGVVVGVVVGGAIVFAIESIGHSLFPPPPDINLANPEDVKRLMASLPGGAFAMVLLGWLAGSLAGALVALRIAQRPAAAWAVAVVFILATTANFTMIPHPAWMIAAGLLIPLASAWLALRLSGVAKRA